LEKEYLIATKNLSKNPKIQETGENLINGITADASMLRFVGMTRASC
jgi:hypothetical protein